MTNSTEDVSAPSLDEINKLRTYISPSGLLLAVFAIFITKASIAATLGGEALEQGSAQSALFVGLIVLSYVLAFAIVSVEVAWLSGKYILRGGPAVYLATFLHFLALAAFASPALWTTCIALGLFVLSVMFYQANRSPRTF